MITLERAKTFLLKEKYKIISKEENSILFSIDSIKLEVIRTGDNIIQVGTDDICIVAQQNIDYGLRLANKLNSDYYVKCAMNLEYGTVYISNEFFILTDIEFDEHIDNILEARSFFINKMQDLSIMKYANRMSLN